MPTSIAPVNSDLNNVVLYVYNMTFGDDSVGFVDEATLNIRVGGRYIKKGVDQISAETAKAWFQGHTITIELTLSAADIEFVNTVLLEGTTQFRPGVSGDAWELGDYGLDVAGVSKELSLVPTANTAGSLANSFWFSKAYVDLDATPLNWTGNKNEFQSLPVTFGVLPDLDQNKEARLGLMGDISALGDASPDGIVITSGRLLNPYKGPTTFTSGVSGQAQAKAYGIWSDDSSLTALDNGGSGTGTALVVDGFSGGTSFAVGDILSQGGELMYVSAKADANNYTLVRGIMGTTVNSITDNDTITKAENVRIVNITNQVVWSEVADGSSVLTLGDTANAVDNTKKGFLQADAANTGSATFKATYTTSLAVATDSNTATFTVA